MRAMAGLEKIEVMLMRRTAMVRTRRIILTFPNVICKTVGSKHSAGGQRK